MASSFRQTVQVYIDTNLTPGARSFRFARIARGVLVEAQASGKASGEHRTFVDNREGVPEYRVQPNNGRIRYEFGRMGDAGEFAIAFLIARAKPVASGTYSRSFRVAVDGRDMAAASFDKNAAAGASEILIYNTQPYSRRIDTHRHGPKVLKYRIPEGLFLAAALAVRTAFPGMVKTERLASVKFANQGTSRKGRKIDSPAVSIRALR